MRAFLYVVVALAAGIGVGYLLGRSSEPSTGRAQRQEQTAQHEPAPVPREEADSDLGRALDRLPVPRFARGDGTITGRVATRDGKPVPGVLLRATPGYRGRPGQSGTGPPRDKTLEEYVRRAVRGYHTRLGTRRDALSTQDGSFVIEGLDRNGKYSVSAYLEDYQLKAQGRAWEVEPGSTLNFVATPAIALPVDVVLPDGTRPELANVQCKAAKTSEGHLWSPEARVLRVAPGRYTVTASVSGDDSYRSDAVEVEATIDKPVAEVLIHLKQRPGIRGAVHLPEGTKLDNVDIHLLKMRPDAALPLDRILKEGRHAWANAHSGFAFKYMDLAPATYLVAVSLGRAALLESRTVEVTDRVARCDFTITQWDPAHFITVRVLGPDGKPVRDVTFTTAYRTQNRSSSGGGSWIVQKDGSFLVTHHREGEEGGEGKHYVTAQTTKYGNREVAYQRGKTREVEIRFGEPATLEVTLTNYVGTDAEGRISLRLVDKSEGRRSAHESSKVGGSGQATLGPVEAGEYDLVVFVKASRHSSLRASAAPVSLRPGENAATVSAPTLLTLTLDVPDGKGQVQLRPERREGWFHASKDLGKEKTVVFENLVAGRYKISVTGGASRGEMSIDLRASKRVTFKAQVINAMCVTLFGDGGAYAKAGLRDGDMVIGVDGEEFKNNIHMWALMAAVREKELCKLLVLRGGRRLEVAVNLKELGESRGGRMERTSR